MNGEEKTRDGETGRQGDGEMGRQNLFVAPSPRPPVLI
jgi:hypothetical protein